MQSTIDFDVIPSWLGPLHDRPQDTETRQAWVRCCGIAMTRRHGEIAEVPRQLEDVDSSCRKYVLWDPIYIERWQYNEMDLEDCFWATGLYNEEANPVMNDRIREVWQHVCDHSFAIVHDPETHEPSREKYLYCRKRRE